MYQNGYILILPLLLNFGVPILKTKFYSIILTHSLLILPSEAQFALKKIYNDRV